MKKRKRFIPEPDENAGPPELEVDPATGVLIGRKEVSRILWSRNNKTEAEERLSPYIPVSLAKRIRRYLKSQGPSFTISRFFILAARHYLESKGQ